MNKVPESVINEANQKYFASKEEEGAKYRITEFQARCVIEAWRNWVPTGEESREIVEQLFGKMTNEEWANWVRHEVSPQSQPLP